VQHLSAWLIRFLQALGHKGPVMVAGHDIGGGVAQHLILAKRAEVPCLAVVNGIMYDSWPVSGVAHFRDPAVAAATTRDDVIAARRVSVVKALGRRLRNISIRGPTPGSLDPGWRSRGGKALYSGDAASPAPIQDAEALGVGRG
jgi:pimeloyl-ACP methyl ester carboxylesterase